MRKKFLSVILILALTFGTCGTVLAADTIGRTEDGLKSYGKIAYQNGSDAVVIDSEDFHMLADRLDLFKQRMADQLQAMHTYFTVEGGMSLQTNADVSVVHTKPSDENIVNPLEVDFDTLLEGIAVSQSVPSDVTTYGFPAGTELYKNKNGVLTTDGTEEGAEKISVTAATADNLSAGTAAWVNGSLILGTGGDNKSYSEWKGSTVTYLGNIGYSSKASYSFHVSLPENAVCLIIDTYHEAAPGLFVYHIPSKKMISSVTAGNGLTLNVSQVTDTVFNISGQTYHTYDFLLWYI